VKYTDVIERVKPGKVGTAELVHDEPSKIERMMGALHGMPLHREKYARLLVNGSIMMTDAEFERATNADFVREACGHVLIAGLGIGLILDPIMEQSESVTVIEKNKDVIDLVGPYFPQVKVIHADIYEWNPPKDARYDTIYFDIWGHFNADTSKDAAKLSRKFKKYLVEDGWMKSWCVIANRARGRR